MFVIKFSQTPTARTAVYVSHLSLFLRLLKLAIVRPPLGRIVCSNSAHTSTRALDTPTRALDASTRALDTSSFSLQSLSIFLIFVSIRHDIGFSRASLAAFVLGGSPILPVISASFVFPLTFATVFMALSFPIIASLSVPKTPLPPPSLLPLLVRKGKSNHDADSNEHHRWFSFKLAFALDILFFCLFLCHQRPSRFRDWSSSSGVSKPLLFEILSPETSSTSFATFDFLFLLDEFHKSCSCCCFSSTKSTRPP